jgi:hypothetical protein
LGGFTGGRLATAGLTAPVLFGGAAGAAGLAGAAVAGAAGESLLPWVKPPKQKHKPKHQAKYGKHGRPKGGHKRG